MVEIKMRINKEVAKICGCSVETVKKYAQKPSNKINFVGEGNRKIYIWFEEDIDRFKNQLRPAPGRPKK
jgi:hypothetical protein